MSFHRSGRQALLIPSKLGPHVECPLNSRVQGSFLSLIAVSPEPRTEPDIWKVLSDYGMNKSTLEFSFLFSTEDPT